MRSTACSHPSYRFLLDEWLACVIRRYYLEVVGRRRLKISRAWELDGYRMAEAKYCADDNPAPNTPEAAQLAQLAASVEALADQWVDKVKCAASSLTVHSVDSLGCHLLRSLAAAVQLSH